MIIKRTFLNQEFEIELSPEEISEAHTEHVTNFMENKFINDFDIQDKSMAHELAVSAYQLYCEGDGYTEYECIEKIYDEYINEKN